MHYDGTIEEVADIVDIASASGDFTTLVAAVEAAGLVETLKGDGPFTVLAPTDAAFAALPAGTVESLLADPSGALTDILLYHVIAGDVMAADVVASVGQEVETVGGNTFAVVVDNHELRLQDGAGNLIALVATDILAANGVIHVDESMAMDDSMASDESMAMDDSMASDESMAMDDTHDDMADSGAMAAEMADIVDIAAGSDSFTTLVAAVQAAGLVDTLKGEGPFTVLAPTDDAFAALPAGTVESLLADPSGALTDILLYHVIPGNVMATDVVASVGQSVETAGGNTFAIVVADGELRFQDGAGNLVALVATDIVASNGVIHVIDAVLLPPAGDEMASDEAMMADEMASDEAMMAEEAGHDMADSGEMVAELADIVDTAVGAGSFTTLVAAVQAAGLVETLKGEGPFTVFAPTDDAFAALPAGTVETLLANPSGALTDILLYHVVAGAVMAADVVGLDGHDVATVGGGTITVAIDGDHVFLHDGAGNAIEVVTTDIKTSNGVIHVIDGVLLPQ